jgi:hypothetical protein
MGDKVREVPAEDPLLWDKSLLAGPSLMLLKHASYQQTLYHQI